jgi:hypothetical protein
MRTSATHTVGVRHLIEIQLATKIALVGRAWRQQLQLLKITAIIRKKRRECGRKGLRSAS